MDTARIRQKERSGENDARHGHGTLPSPPPAAGRAARKKDLTPAHEWHTYHDTPRCGAHVGK